MTVGSVTFRSTAGIESFGPIRPVWAPPLAYKTAPTPSSHPLALRGTEGTHRRAALRAARAAGKRAGQAAAKRALIKLAWKLTTSKLGIAGEIGPQILTMFWNKHIDPTGFPGWGSFPAEFTSDAGTPYPAASPGDYTANGFDVGPWSSVVHNVVDTSDGSPIGGFRYWGHFHGSTPLPAGRPGDDWEIRTYAMPTPATATRTKTRSGTRYTRLVDLAPGLQTQRWHNRQNIAITIRTGFRKPIDITQNVPRKRKQDTKVLPRNKFVWLVLKKFANAGGELKEWTDIFAEASGYIKGSMMVPEELRHGDKETQAKLYWLFVVTGINSIDWHQLAVLVVENEIEDIVYGSLGQLSKAAAQNLGMTVGPQTGLVM